eukprot:7750435-Pyramimonas_sp.AAC.1
MLGQRLLCPSPLPASVRPVGQARKPPHPLPPILPSSAHGPSCGGGGERSARQVEGPHCVPLRSRWRRASDASGGAWVPEHGPVQVLLHPGSLSCGQTPDVI